jgi:hypothetical protein
MSAFSACFLLLSDLTRGEWETRSMTSTALPVLSGWRHAFCLPCFEVLRLKAHLNQYFNSKPYE